MSLMSLVRWIGAVAIGWTLVAIGLGAAGARLPGRAASGLPTERSTAFEVIPTNWPTAKGYDLIDRTDGRRTPLPLPGGDRWTEIVAAPWHGPGGAMEAVGRWVNPARAEFSGWAVFRIADGVISSRVATEILPMGRPCCVPHLERTILFGAADGHLYRCRLPAEGEEPLTRHVSAYASGCPEPSDRVHWEVAPPSLRDPMVLDPAWPAGPRSRRLVLVSIMSLERHDRRSEFSPSHLWWLELSEDAGAIVAAGRLTEPIGKGTGLDRIEQRYPNLAVGADGRCRLVFLERRNREKGWHMRSLALEFDPKGYPRVRPGRDVPIADSRDRLAPAPLLPSADGERVYAFARSGELGVWPVIPPESRRMPAVGDAPNLNPARL